MKGLIVGLSLASAGLSPALSGATLTTWTHTWSPPVTYPTCAFWFYLFHYCGDSDWSSDVWDCGQVVQEEGKKRTP